MSEAPKGETSASSCLSDLGCFAVFGAIIVFAIYGAISIWNGRQKSEEIEKESSADASSYTEIIKQLETTEIDAPIEFNPPSISDVPLETPPVVEPVPKPATADGPVDVPVTFPIRLSREFEPEVVLSRLSRYPDAFSYEFKARFVAGRYAITEYALEIDLIEPGGEAPVATAKIEILNGTVTALPGDTVTARGLIHEKRALPEEITAVARVVKSELEPHEGAVSRGAWVEQLQKRMGVPEAVEIRVRERSKNLRADALNRGETDLTLVLEIENTGEADIRVLEIEIQPYAANGRVLEAAEGPIERRWPPNVSPVAFALEPPWKPGERRLEWVHLDLPNVKPEEVLGYRVGIFKAQ